MCPAMDAGEEAYRTLLSVGLLVMIVLLVLTPVFKYMPNNAQGAIIIAAVIGLFNYTEWLFLWKVIDVIKPIYPAGSIRGAHKKWL